MTETDRIESAEQAILDVLKHESQPVSASKLGELLREGETSRSLVRLAIQRMIGRGDVTYDTDRRYSLGHPHPQA